MATGREQQHDDSDYESAKKQAELAGGVVVYKIKDRTPYTVIPPSEKRGTPCPDKSFGARYDLPLKATRRGV